MEDKIILFPGDPQNEVKRFSLFQHAIDLIPKSIPVRVVILKGIPRDLVPWYMSASDVLVLTSLYESAPLVVKEALACDLPCISVDVRDVKETITEVKNCFICQPDPPAIAEKVLYVLRDGERPNGRQRIEQLGVSSIAIAERLIRLYREVCEKP